MLKRSILGRGFDSPRLHQPSLRNEVEMRRLPRRSSISEGGLDCSNNTEATARHAMKFFYVYILQSGKNPKRHYTGFTENLESRLKAHNAGQDPHTAKFKPWRIKTAIAFTDKQKALDFESYLKSPSGRAFAKKHL
jgi:putative endonuclease